MTLNTMDAYQALQNDNNADPSAPLLGVILPNLQFTGVDIEAKRVRAADLPSAVLAFAPTQSWVCFRDEIAFNLLSLDRVDVLEAEFTNGTKTLTIKHVYGDEYQIVIFTPSEQASQTQGYKTQAMALRPFADQDSQLALYRIWFELSTEGASKGRWQPLAQQFVGFEKA